MKIIKIVLENCIYFEVANHKRIVINIGQPIQLIIGDNGSGKTSLLNTMDLFPANRNHFRRNGYKEIELTYQGSKYNLVTDFSNRQHPHYFYKDGTNLNESGLVTLQEELLDTEFGYNKLTHSLFFNTNSFTTMTNAQRKAHILNLNPFDLVYFLDLHKQIMREIRACKSNLKMLMERKGDIESRLADKSIIQAKQKEHKELGDLKLLIDKGLFTTRQYIKQDQDKLSNYGEGLNIDDIKKDVNEARRFLAGLHMVREDVIDTHGGELESLQSSIRRLEEGSLWDAVKEVEDYQQQLDKLTKGSDGTQSKLEKQVAESEKILKSLEKEKNNFPNINDSSIIDGLYDRQDSISTQVGFFTGFELDQFLSEDKISGMEFRRSKCQSELNRLKHDLEDSSSNAAKLTIDIKNFRLQTQPVDHCNTCDLFKHSESNYKDLQVELTKYQKRSEVVASRISNLEERLKVYDTFLDKYKTPSRNFEVLKRTIASLNIFSQQWLDEELSKMILQRPTRLLDVLTGVIGNYRRNKQKEELEKELVENIKALDELKVTNKTSRNYLEKILQDKKKRKKELQIEHTNLLRRYNKVKFSLKYREGYTTRKSKLVQLDKDLSIELQRVEVLANMNYQKKLEGFLNNVSRSIDDDLRKLDIFLEEQLSLKDRYDKEIKPLIKEQKDKQAEYEEMELAVSPTRGIPHRHLVQTINNYIDMVNVIVSKVWNFKFELEHVDENKEIDFKFPLQIRSAKIPDIAECSRGEKMILDIAWNIAGMIGKDVKSFPLYLDEPDNGLDRSHKDNLLDMLNFVLDTELISQLYLISHETNIYESFAGGEVIALMYNNIVIPEITNAHVEFS